MTSQPQIPSRNREDHPEPKALERARAFMQERLASGRVDSDGDPIQVDPAQLPKRSEQIAEYRSLEAKHNPVFPGVNDNSGSGQVVGEDAPGLLIGDQNIADDLLPGHFYPIGPSALLNGQANNKPTVSGRTTALSIGNDGQRIYAGAANGGVWRSDNGGRSWRPLMNAIHLAPTTLQSDTLAIGAVAMDPDQPDRIFVGTGEGPGRVSLAGSPEFFGVGPLVSEDGGFSWQAESVGETRLTGSAFFKMVVDPEDRNKVTAASRKGVMQRKPRNRRLNTTFKPQVYFYRQGFDTGSLSTFYWNEDATSMTRAWAGGGGYLSKNAWMTPFVFNGIPYFLEYDRDTGKIALDFWKGNGSPSQTLTTNFLEDDIGKGWTDLLPVTLMGRAFILTYAASTGLATLWFLDIRNDDLFYLVEPFWKNRNFGKGWTNFISVTIQGQPYFLAYNLLSGSATLQQWLPNGEFVRVFRKSLDRRLRITSFTLREKSYWLWVSSLDGSGQLNLWNEDGSYDSIRVFPKKTFTESLNLQLIPYLFNGESRLLTYDLNTGGVDSFRWTSDWNLELLESQTWDRNLIVNTFNMGYEWVEPTFTPKPSPSPNVPDSDTPTASGLAFAQSAGITHYFAAFWDDNVYRSTDGGDNWSILGTGFPRNAGRVAIASQCDNQDVVYAFLQDGTVYRWDVRDGKWRKISGVPPKAELVGKQGFYDLVVAVSPNDIDTIYLGGAAFSGGAALYRCKVNYSIGTIFNSVSMVPTWIGSSVHADVHALAFTECSPDDLWVGCDGGVFFSALATSKDPDQITTLFEARNCGLGTQTVNFLTQHPTEDAIVFCGTQDNGCQRTIGNEAWELSSNGDGGKVLINWSKSQEVSLPYIRNQYSINTGGGSNPKNNESHLIPNVVDKDTLFYPPFAGTPVGVGVDPASKRMAFGSKRVWVNDGFGKDNDEWKGLTTANLGSASGFKIITLFFQTNQRILAGLVNGRIYRYDEDAGADPVVWAQLRLDDQGQGLPVSGPITGFAPDPEDNTNTNFFISMGGSTDDFRRVWYFDGNGWEARSGPSKGDINALLDIQYNALAVARIDNKTHLFAAADIGIWHSQDGGKHWRPFSVALPETAVFDLQIFPGDQVSNRPWLLRAATYGRSNFERVIAGGTASLKKSLTQPVQLYMRTNALDRGLYPASTREVEGYVNNANLSDVRLSVDMKLRRSEDGSFETSPNIDFCQFETLTSQNFVPMKTQKGRFYMRVHTRGVATVDQVEVRIIQAKVNAAAKGIDQVTPAPALPANFASLIQSGKAMPNNSSWEDLGSSFVNGLFAGTPLVTSVEFDLLQEGSFFVLAILHQAKDPFVDKETDPLVLIKNNRQAVMSYFISDFS